MQEVEYFVYEEKDLVYKFVDRPFYLVLASLILKGSIHRSGDSIHVPNPEALRPATIEDFETFRVCHKGHIEA